MDNDLLALVAILPGIEAAIEKLEAERDIIVGRLGLAPKKKRRAQPLAVVPVAVEPPDKKKTSARYKRVKCPECGKFFQGSQGMAAHRRSAHKKDAA
jgi:hypothetical protein